MPSHLASDATNLPDLTAGIGSPPNSWTYSSKTGFDLTHSNTSLEETLTLKTTTTPITIAPSKSALIIIDMQNFFLSPAFGRKRGAGHDALDKLVRFAIPAARGCGMRVVWVNWGLTEEDMEVMPAGVSRAFGFEGLLDGKKVAVDKHGKEGGTSRGLGSPCGIVRTEDGEEIDAGRLLMKDSWNAALYPPLDGIFEQGRGLEKSPDVLIPKNRMSALWSSETPLNTFLEEEGIKTLLMTGVNTDQCVGGTFMDAFSKGYDCVLLSDGAGTSSPQFAQECFEYNAAETFGFAMSCEMFAEAVGVVG
ncbi:hypothetical protein FKW77_008346 [Venturia effusa]|uniref:Isochorismatase-like domain-containing protein n=1 Tax=Venturia effusa TaxID=50376 RepID=A0A517LHR4_9PEZI|nr:hypothetical protein FKW77_008346 [Venturia effusa]